MTKWFRGTMQERLEAFSIPEPNSGCWLWLGANNRFGYGAVNINGVAVRANRLSYETFCGPIAASLCVLHRCDNPYCVNPDHLFLGTMKDNSNDRDAKRRTKTNPPKGERHWNSRLTNMQIRAIRLSEQTCEVLATEYGLTKDHIRKIKNGKHWRHT